VLAFVHGHDHQPLDEALRRALASAALADADHACTGRCHVDDVVADQVVDQEEGGRLDGLERPERELFGVARAGVDQRAAALRCGMGAGRRGSESEAHACSSA
jgi:hypothetical protein